jgi:hypothetical protein
MAPAIILLSGGPVAWAEATSIGSPDQPESDLGLRVASEQAVRGGNLVGIYLESARLDIDGDKLTVILGAEKRLYLALIELIAAPGRPARGSPGARAGRS